MNYKKYFFVLVILFSSISFGQNDYRTWIKGKVLYKNVNVEGANVINNTSQIATTTNSEGEFEIEVKLNDKILFSHPTVYQQIKPDIEKFNLWNSDTWFFPVETGNLFMFPSSTTHQVETKQGNNTRISLAFNAFYKGTVGNNFNLTELIL